MTASPETPRPDRSWRRVRTVLLVVAAAFALFNAALYVYGLTLPDEWRVQRSVVIDAPASSIYPLVAGSKRWSGWSPWSTHRDPSLRLTYAGPESGEGASFSWIGRDLGTGAVTVTAAEPNRSVGYAMELQGQPFSADGRITLEPEGDGTRVTWSDRGELEGTAGRLFGSRMEQVVGADFDAGLSRLKAVAEASAIAEPR